MKTVYLVRHGQTHANTTQAWQDAHDTLTETGVAQAENVAERLGTLPITYAITSEMKRAVQTADKIVTKIQPDFVQSKFFVEARVPSSTVGQTYIEEDGNLCFEYIKARIAHAHNPDFRYEDEETLTELVGRAKEALAFLESVEADRILVVTHGTFLRVLLNVVMHQGVTDDPYILFSTGRNMQTVNTGISVITQKHAGEDWSLLTFNDLAHYAE